MDLVLENVLLIRLSEVLVFMHIMSGIAEYRNGFNALLIGMMIRPIGKYESRGTSSPAFAR